MVIQTLELPIVLPRYEANLKPLLELLDKCSKEIVGGCDLCSLAGCCAQVWDSIPSRPDGSIAPEHVGYYERQFEKIRGSRRALTAQERNNHHCHGVYNTGADWVEDEPFESLRLPLEE